MSDDIEHLDWGGTRHPVLSRVTIGSAGAVAGALAVIVGPGLVTHSAAHPPAPRTSTDVIGRATKSEVSEWRLIHEREGVDLGLPQHGCG